MEQHYNVTEKFENGSHVCAVFRVADADGWLQAVAGEYVQLRGASILPVEAVKLDEITVVDVEGIRKRLATATVPRRNKAKGNFDVLRSDFGETLSFMILRDRFSMRLVYAGVRDRELVELPGRGPDTFGVEDGEKISVVLGEVKVSGDGSCPPAVVDAGADCLRAQHLSHVGKFQKTIDKLWHMSKHCRDRETQRLAHTALLYLENEVADKVRVVAFSLLVRPADKYAVGDFGTFRSRPEMYKPADVRFVTFCVPGGIEDLVDQWDLVLGELTQ